MNCRKSTVHPFLGVSFRFVFFSLVSQILIERLYFIKIKSVKQPHLSLSKLEPYLFKLFQIRFSFENFPFPVPALILDGLEYGRWYGLIHTGKDREKLCVFESFEYTIHFHTSVKKQDFWMTSKKSAYSEVVRINDESRENKRFLTSKWHTTFFSLFFF